MPALGIDAKVESVGKKSDGSMGTPSTWTAVAWYDLGPKPGEAGNAVIDGHVDNALTTAGVFQHLSDIGLGDVIEVSDAEGHILRYSVSEVDEYAVNGGAHGQHICGLGPLPARPYHLRRAIGTPRCTSLTSVWWWLRALWPRDKVGAFQSKFSSVPS